MKFVDVKSLLGRKVFIFLIFIYFRFLDFEGRVGFGLVFVFFSYSKCLVNVRLASEGLISRLVFVLVIE